MFHEIFWCIKNHLCCFIFNVFIKYLFVIVLLSGVQVLIVSNATRVLLLIKIFHFKIRHVWSELSISSCDKNCACFHVQYVLMRHCNLACLIPITCF